jgi:hypothetical protein
MLFDAQAAIQPFLRIQRGIGHSSHADTVILARDASAKEMAMGAM